MKRVIAMGLLCQVSLAQAGQSDAQNDFFERLSKLCGQSYAGVIKVDNQPSDSFSNKPLVMHVRDCSEEQIKIPFHVGEDRSRTWVISKTPQGLSLYHDHRHKDGTSSELTMYGGYTLKAGEARVQAFPVDKATKEMFIAQNIPQSVTNTWKVMVDEGVFSYRLERPGREFQVDFDLSKQVKTPPPAWGH